MNQNTHLTYNISNTEKVNVDPIYNYICRWQHQDIVMRIDFNSYNAKESSTINKYNFFKDNGVVPIIKISEDKILKNF